MNPRHDDVTILIYTFPWPGSESGVFSRIQASLERTWAMVGRLKTVIVASHHFEAVDVFSAANPEIELQIESSLIPGKIKTMSMDCIKRLHTRFSTPYVLIIQDDGYPVRGNLDEFIGKADFWGAPIISDGWKRRLAYSIGLGSFNGGFSLRTHRICAYASKAWRYFFRFLFREDSQFLGEDFYYTTLVKLLPTTWFRYRFPSEGQAFHFSFDALDGHVKLPIETKRPFGIHGKFTIQIMNKWLGGTPDGTH